MPNTCVHHLGSVVAMLAVFRACPGVDFGL